MDYDADPDPNWYIENVLVPGDIERHHVGPVRASRVVDGARESARRGVRSG